MSDEYVCESLYPPPPNLSSLRLPHSLLGIWRLMLLSLSFLWLILTIYYIIQIQLWNLSEECSFLPSTEAIMGPILPSAGYLPMLSLQDNWRYPQSINLYQVIRTGIQGALGTYQMIAVEWVQCDRRHCAVSDGEGRGNDTIPY